VAAPSGEDPNTRQWLGSACVTSPRGVLNAAGIAQEPLPGGFYRLLVTQFASALADNALLLVALAFLLQQGHPAWWAPLLKFSFTMAYVVLAPVAGPVADGIPKAWLMAWMNAIKIVGVLMLCLGVHPLLAFAVVGLGAAGYAPAKYGLVTELIEPVQLVRANAWLEVSVVSAVLLGTAAGGLLISDTVAHWPPYAALAQALATPAWAAGSPLGAALVLVLLVYLVSSALNFGLPDSGRRYASEPSHPVALLRQFGAANAALWRDAKGGRISLSVTTIFWGVGAVLQFAVLRHATETLGLTLAQASGMQAAVAVGIVLGAMVAARCVPLAQAAHLLPLGLLLGLMIMAGAWINSVGATVLLMVAVGAAGGLLVVPMNALLQHRGYQLLTAGRSIAVQGFNENASILVMLGLYAIALRVNLSSSAILLGLGGLLALGMATLWVQHRRLAAGMRAAPGFDRAHDKRINCLYD
jgi:MFS transporter, LPLT family, lysophospholipid transporter